MLVLTRKKGERVMIGDDIVVTLIDVRGDGVRIGFDAPRGVKIQRAEVVTAVTEANTASAVAAESAEGTADLLAGLLAAARRPPAQQPGAAEPASASAQEARPSTPPPPAAPAQETRPAAPRTPPKPAPRAPRP